MTKINGGKRKSKEALDIDPYTVAWMLKRKNKLIPDIVGHVPREVSESIWFFFMHGEKWRQVYIYSTITIPDPKWRIRNHA